LQLMVDSCDHLVRPRPRKVRGLRYDHERPTANRFGLEAPTTPAVSVNVTSAVRNPCLTNGYFPLSRVQSDMRYRHFVLSLGIFPTLVETQFKIKIFQYLKPR
jgi:hypothetical protein